MGTVTILPQTTTKPITLIGQMAGVCYGADTSDEAKNYKRGWDCIESGHGRTEEFPDIYMILDGYSARVIREWYTHIGCLPTRLQESTRYVDYGDFGYITPPSIEDNKDAIEVYQTTMRAIANAEKFLVDELNIPREDAANLLPIGMITRIVDKRNLRNLIDMSRQRECERAYWEYRRLFSDLKLALYTYSEEWSRLVSKTMHPKCVEYGYCPEKHGCGKYPGREG